MVHFASQNTHRADGDDTSHWQPIETLPRDGRWVVVIDKFGNANCLRWDDTPLKLFPDRVRGWMAKGGFGPAGVPEMDVGWVYAPNACTELRVKP